MTMRTRSDPVSESFLTSETGAVTVDWVVLTAGLVGLGLATMAVVSTGVQDVSGDTEAQLSETLIYTSFNQRKFSALFAAAKAQAELGLTAFVPSDPNTHFANITDPVLGLSDAELVSYMQDNTTWHATIAERRQSLEQFSSTPSAADLAAVTNMSEQQLQDYVNNSLGGDMDMMLAKTLAEYTMMDESAKFAAQLADERGLSY